LAGIVSRPDGAVLSHIDLPHVTPKKGYAFKGWEPDPLGVTVNSSLTFTAMYDVVPVEDEQEKVHVSFVVGEGGSIEGTTELMVDKGTHLENLQFPTAIPHMGYTFVGWDEGACSQTIDKDVNVVIEPGSSTTRISRQLCEAGLTKKDISFKLYSRINEIDSQLKAGNYTFEAGSWSLKAIAATLIKGVAAADDVRVTTPEGLMVKEVAQIFADAELCDYDTFMEAATNGDFSDYDFIPAAGDEHRLEGFLFPDTYMISPRWSAEEIITNPETFVVDITISPANDICVTLDSDSSVSVDDCVAISRAMSARIDEITDDYSLVVTSAGIGQPLKLLRQYHKLIGRSVEVVLADGAKILAVLDAADENGITVSYQEKVAVEGKKRKQLVDVVKTYTYDEIRTTAEWLDYK
jgi:ribosome maturation factor RimP